MQELTLHILLTPLVKDMESSRYPDIWLTGDNTTAGELGPDTCPENAHHEGVQGVQRRKRAALGAAEGAAGRAEDIERRE